jgi:molecular chaperone DnaK (HSP70)
MLSSTGVDFGTLQTVVAVARNRGVDVVRSSLGDGSPIHAAWSSRLLPLKCISALHGLTHTSLLQITNEVSNRATP